MQDNRIVIWLDFEAGDAFAAEQNKCGSLSDSRCLSVASVSQGFSSDVIIQGDFSREDFLRKQYVYIKTKCVGRFV